MSETQTTGAQATGAQASGCPVHHAGRDDRKTAASHATQSPFAGSRLSKSWNFARDVLRSPDVRQAGGDAATKMIDNPDHASFFFLDGDVHRKRRASVAGYFTPKAIVTRYMPVMEKTMDEIIAEFRSKGRMPLGDMSFRLACSVAFEIVGLNDVDPEGTANRIRTIMTNTNAFERRPLRVFFHHILLGGFNKWLFKKRTDELYEKDILPAVALRKANPKDDVISYMIEKNYSKQAMIMEVMNYGGAGITTTREFIMMAVWQLFDHPDLMQRFLNGDEADQFAIIEEILRLDPLAAFLYRVAAEDIPTADGDVVKKGEVVAINLRASNWDTSMTGECPYQLDPDRGKRMKVVGPYMSFGDGPHRCPGSQVALHETRLFLDRFLRVPGVKLVSTPKITWSMSNGTYEVANAYVECDRA